VIVDALCMNLAIKPQQYQMLVLPNLQGDIVSDLAAGLVGGPGFAPAQNIGSNIAIFEAVHGTAPDIAGKGIANPTSLILSGLMMLRHVGLLKQAAALENALLAAARAGLRTGDFGDPSLPGYRKEPATTAQFVEGIVEKLGEKPKTVPAVAVPEQSTPTFSHPPPERPAGHPHVRERGDDGRRVRHLPRHAPLAPGRGRRDAARHAGHALQAHAHLQPRHAGVAQRQRVHRMRRLLPRPLRAPRRRLARRHRPEPRRGPDGQDRREVRGVQLRAAPLLRRRAGLSRWRRASDATGRRPAGTDPMADKLTPNALAAQILIVEDEPDHADVMAEALRKFSHVCTVVESVDAAMEELRLGTFDVIITDLRMPASGGRHGVASDGGDAGLKVLEAAEGCSRRPRWCW
jgi:hypothetical protein